jgi:hypothetical protein
MNFFQIPRKNASKSICKSIRNAGAARDLAMMISITTMAIRGTIASDHHHLVSSVMM